MRIAFYDKGNVKDDEKYGLGTIYDEKGELLVKKKEKILVKEEDVRCLISNKWSFLNFTPIFMDSGVGTLYKTDQR
ncbi:MAG: hypothetical protein L6265_11195, partial [Thermoplasmatales archaeon]|nr:hypothetical protein [Thermoplasmatales archaeon]